MTESMENKLRSALATPAAPPLEATRRFLERYVVDADGMAEVEQSIVRMAKSNPRTLLEALAGIEGLLANFPEKIDVARQMIVCEIGWVLDDDSDNGVKNWLARLTEILHRHVDAGPADKL